MRSSNNVAVISILIALVAMIIIILSATYVVSSESNKRASVDNLIDPLVGLGGGSNAGYSTPNVVNVYGGSSNNNDDDDDNDPEIDLGSSMGIVQGGIVIFNLDQHASDDEDDHDELEFDLIAPLTNTIIDININHTTHEITIIGIGTPGQSTTLIIEVEDSDGNTDSDSIPVTILGSGTGTSDSPVIIGIPDIAFGEDGADSSIDLDDYVTDADHLDSELTWTFTGNTDVQISINSTNTATFTATPNWFGAEFITFTATDPDGNYAQDVMLVTVTPVDDMAIWNPLSTVNINEDTVDGTIIYTNIALEASDVDNAIVMSVISVTPLFTLNLVGNDLVITNLQADWYGSRTITMDANGITTNFQLNVAQLFDDPVQQCGPYGCVTDYY